MTYLTSAHQPAPAYVAKLGMLHPTAEALTANDTARLAELDIWPHVIAEGPAPLGYTDWAFGDDVYTRRPAGTPEEIAAALEQQAAEQLAQRRAEMSLSRLDGRLKLIEIGLWDTVTAYFADPARTAVELAYWQDAQTWRRTDPILIAAAQAFGLNDDQLDALFTGGEFPA